MGAAPKAYQQFADDLADLIPRARGLGLFRTAEKVHAALMEARSETFEAMPRDEVTINFVVGPFGRQTT